MYLYSNRNVPYLRDHAAALKHHDSITPLMGGALKGHRPVGARRKTYQRIWVTPTGDVKVTEGWREHYTNVEVTFCANGMTTVVCPNGKPSAGSLGFIGKLLGIEINERGNRLWVHGVTQRKRATGANRWDRSQDTTVFGSFPLMQGVYLRLQREDRNNPGGQLIVQDPVWPTVRNTDRAGAKQVRAMYREFTDYLRGFHGLMSNGIPDTMMTEEEITALSSADMVPMIRSGTPRDYLRVALFLAKRAPTRNRWRFQLNATDFWIETKNASWRLLDTILLDAHADLAYRWQTRYDGNVYRDNVKLVKDRG